MVAPQSPLRAEGEVDRGSIFSKEAPYGKYHAFSVSKFSVMVGERMLLSCKPLLLCVAKVVDDPSIRTFSAYYVFEMNRGSQSPA